MSCFAYVSATGLIHDGFAQNNQKIAKAELATATASRITAMLSGLTRTFHYGSGQDRPHTVSTNNAHATRASATAMGNPQGLSPHMLRLNP